MLACAWYCASLRRMRVERRRRACMRANKPKVCGANTEIASGGRVLVCWGDKRGDVHGEFAQQNLRIPSTFSSYLILSRPHELVAPVPIVSSPLLSFVSVRLDAARETSRAYRSVSIRIDSRSSRLRFWFEERY